MQRSVSTLVVAVAWLCGSRVMAQLDDPTTVFFFGDASLSIFDLTRHFQASYQRATGLKINVQRHSPDGATLSTHVNFMVTDAEAPDFHNNNNNMKYRWMVLQERWDIAALPSWRDNSTMAAQTLHSYTEDARDVRTMFMMTWGSRNGFVGNGVHYQDFPAHNEVLFDRYRHYTSATWAPFNPTFLAPVGLVFETIYKDCVDANVDPLDWSCLFSRLFMDDSNFPSVQGTYVAGLTVATAMTGYDPMRQIWSSDSDIYVSDFDSVDTFLIRMAVSRTILDTFNSGRIQYPWSEAWPTLVPSRSPSKEPSSLPPNGPSSGFPSVSSSLQPSHPPTQIPSRIPSTGPSDGPSTVPSQQLSLSPSNEPSISPSLLPNTGPSGATPIAPSASPRPIMSPKPSWSPSMPPSASSSPTKSSSMSPSDAPSGLLLDDLRENVNFSSLVDAGGSLNQNGSDWILSNVARRRVNDTTSGGRMNQLAFPTLAMFSSTLVVTLHLVL
jgi:hypothetical protein